MTEDTSEKNDEKGKKKLARPSDAEIQRTIKEILNCDFIKRLSKRYPIDAWQNGDGVIYTITLRDGNGKTIDVITSFANASIRDSVVNALKATATSFEMGLNNGIWKIGLKLLRDRFNQSNGE